MNHDVGCLGLSLRVAVFFHVDPRAHTVRYSMDVLRINSLWVVITLENLE